MSITTLQISILRDRLLSNNESSDDRKSLYMIYDIDEEVKNQGSMTTKTHQSRIKIH